jgi:hypothetical protein
LWAQQAAVFGAPASDSTIGRTLAAVDDGLLAKVAKARAQVRRHVWALLMLRPPDAGTRPAVKLALVSLGSRSHRSLITCEVSDLDLSGVSP